MADLRVLLVDDSPDVRRLLVTRLELEGGYVVVDEAENGAEAIVKATKHQPDVIVLDAMMPVLTGVDALPAIVLGSPGAKIVVYSAFTDDPALERIYDAGAHAVVNKSAPLDQLFLAIRGVL
ncbi:MAG TPA: response regulator transcription factor [Acidimicrobiales bacterium]|nr:response regulator transcription factor [Acidimicrobiales bacterium]